MKRLFMVIFTIFSLTFCACSSKASPETTANNFMQAMENGDLQKASTYFDSKVSDQFNSLMGSLSDLQLDTDTLNSIQTSLLKAVFQDHKIIETKDISASQKEITVEVTGISTDSITDFISHAYDQISTSDLLQIFSSDGEEAAIRYILDQLQEIMKKELPDATTTYQMHLTLDQKDNGWIISNIK